MISKLNSISYEIKTWYHICYHIWYHTFCNDIVYVSSALNIIWFCIWYNCIISWYHKWYHRMSVHSALPPAAPEPASLLRRAHTIPDHSPECQSLFWCWKILPDLDCSGRVQESPRNPASKRTSSFMISYAISHHYNDDII